MTIAIAQTIISPWLTPVRVVSTSNLAGTYFNGNNNDGVGAILTIASSSLSIDSVTLNVSDRLLLIAQTSSNQNGIYIVKSIDPVGSLCVIQRAEDQQSLAQYKAGQNAFVYAGASNAGKYYVLTEPLPAKLGISALNWTTPSSGGGITLEAAGSFFSLSGGATRTFPLTGVTPESVIIANPSVNTNSEPVLSVTPGTNSFTMTFAGDPGIIQIMYMAIF